MGYAELYFGHADARTEVIREPESFRKSFVDHSNVVEAVTSEGRFLVLGPKGTGKSAMAWFLQETGAERGLRIATRDASELPMSEVASVKTGEGPGLSRSLNAWRFLILCSLVDVIISDPKSRLSQNAEALAIVEKLRDFGFLDSTPKEAILRASQITWKVPLPAFGSISSREAVTSLHLVNLLPYLEKWILEEVAGPGGYYIALDGLDSIYLNDPRYIPAISGLVQSALSINQSLRRQGSPAGVLVLMRNDVFSRLELPDGGKVREDWAVNLDWRQLSGAAASAPLFRLVNNKAVSSTGGEPFDVVGTHFPPEIELGGYGSERETFGYLLNLTRHTPRDLLRLLEHIRRVEAQAPVEQRKVVLTDATIREGVLQYATKYFVDAVRNELVGRGGSSAVGQAVVDALRALRSKRFDRSLFRAKLEEKRLDQPDLPSAEEALRWLFFAGAIGNEVPGGQKNYLQFFHRRDDSEVYADGPLILHNALVHAWALPWN